MSFPILKGKKRVCNFKCLWWKPTKAIDNHNFDHWSKLYKSNIVDLMNFYMNTKNCRTMIFEFPNKWNQNEHITFCFDFFFFSIKNGNVPSGKHGPGAFGKVFNCHRKRFNKKKMYQWIGVCYTRFETFSSAISVFNLLGKRY